MRRAFAAYLWIVVLGCITAFFAAFGIGANDVANAYATSVGSKALTIKQACALAVVFEFAGAVAAGSAVSDTIRKKIADVECFEDDPALLMYGCFCVIISVGLWLIIASWAEMPVSTTHSCVGGMIGMAIVAKGADCVIWTAPGDEEKLWLPQGVTSIILSWVFSPVFSGIFACLLYKATRALVLRSNNSFRNAIRFYPGLVFVAVTINAFFVLSKGIKSKICPKDATEDIFLCRWEDGKPKGKTDPGGALGLAVATGFLFAVCGIPLYRWIERHVSEEFNLSSSTATARPADAKSAAVKEVNVEVAADPPAEAKPPSAARKMFNALMTNLNTNVHESVAQSTTVAAIHANAEQFKPEAEAVFRYIQIFTAICDSFAHGANDVANAMGPYMAIYFIYKSGSVSSKYEVGDNGYWILGIGGLGIGLGLLLYGYKIMRAIGVKLAVITPSRGVSIELGAAIVIIIGSYLGIPLSTTHCQVGATTGVALLEGRKGVNSWVLGKAIVGWIITLIVVGFTCAILFAFGTNSPLADGPRDALYSQWQADNVCNSTAVPLE